MENKNHGDDYLTIFILCNIYSCGQATNLAIKCTGKGDGCKESMDGGGEGWILQRLQASLWILSRHKTKSTNISFLLTTRLHTWGSLAGPSGPIGRINPWFHGPKQAPGNVNRYEMRTLHDMRGWGHDLAAAPGEVGTGSAAVNAGQTVGRPSGRAAGQGGRAAGSRGNMGPVLFQ